MTGKESYAAVCCRISPAPHIGRTQRSPHRSPCLHSYPLAVAATEPLFQAPHLHFPEQRRAESAPFNVRSETPTRSGFSINHACNGRGAMRSWRTGLFCRAVTVVIVAVAQAPILNSRAQLELGARPWLGTTREPQRVLSFTRGSDSVSLNTTFNFHVYLSWLRRDILTPTPETPICTLCLHPPQKQTWRLSPV